MKDEKNLINRDKAFILTKVRQDDNDIKIIIKEDFEDPQKYLKENSSVIIGNKIFQKFVCKTRKIFFV